MTTARTSVFLSYAHPDQQLARTLHDGLVELGYFVWIDEGELKAGDSLIESISGAIEQVDFIVVLVSESSRKSRWCQKELSLAMTGEIEGRKVDVLPCRVGRAEMPASLKDKLYVDLDDDSVFDAVARLHGAMDRHREPKMSRARSDQLSARDQELVRGTLSELRHYLARARDQLESHDFGATYLADDFDALIQFVDQRKDQADFEFVDNELQACWQDLLSAYHDFVQHLVVNTFRVDGSPNHRRVQPDLAHSVDPEEQRRFREAVDTVTRAANDAWSADQKFVRLANRKLP